MGKGLSPLQIAILTVLDERRHEQAATPGRLDVWALPRDIIERLGMPKNAGTRASVSRALSRLHERDLVAREAGPTINVGRAFRYRRIDPADKPPKPEDAS